MNRPVTLIAVYDTLTLTLRYHLRGTRRGICVYLVGWYKLTNWIAVVPLAADAAVYESHSTGYSNLHTVITICFCCL